MTRTAGTGRHGKQWPAAADVSGVPCRVSQPNASEVERARTMDVDYATPIYFPTGTDVRRHDRVTITASPVAAHLGLDAEVTAVVSPSQPAYVRADCLRIEET